MNHLQFIPTVFAATAADNISGLVDDPFSGVSDISDAMTRNGVTIVVLAIFFVIFIGVVWLLMYNHSRMVNRMLKNNGLSQEAEQQRQSKQEELIADIVKSILNDRDDKDNKANEELVKATKELHDTIELINKKNNDEKNNYHNDIVGAYIDINMAFKDASRSVLEKLKCDRVATYVFHNGNESLYGLPFFKMSCVCEWTSKGSKTLRGLQHVNLPLHVFNDFIESLWKNCIYKIDNINNDNIDEGIEEFIKFSSTRALYAVGVKNSNGALAGFVVVEYDNPGVFDMDNEVDKNIRNTIEDMITIIRPIVTSKYIKK